MSASRLSKRRMHSTSASEISRALEWAPHCTVLDNTASRLSVGVIIGERRLRRSRRWRSRRVVVVGCGRTPPSVSQSLSRGSWSALTHRPAVVRDVTQSGVRESRSDCR